MILTDFRTNLRAAMRSHPMTAVEICRKAGYNPCYVRKVLAGRYNPTLMFAECMANALNTTVTQLIEQRDNDEAR